MIFKVVNISAKLQGCDRGVNWRLTWCNSRIVLVLLSETLPKFLINYKGLEIALFGSLENNSISGCGVNMQCWVDTFILNLPVCNIGALEYI